MIINTEVVRASVFLKGAEIVRRGSAELQEGAQTLYIRGLSETALQNTARLFSSSGVSCKDFRFGPWEPEGGEKERIRERDEKIDALKLQIEVKELQKKLWQENGNFTNRASQPMAELENYLEKLPERLQKLEEETAGIRKEIAALEKEKAEYEELCSLPVMQAEVTAEQPGTFPLELRYFEPSAAWAQVNELHADTENPPELRLRARITQSTHEDWKGVKISLFTGNPASGDRLPELRPRYLDLFEPDTMRTISGAGSAAGNMGMLMMSRMAMPMGMAEGNMMQMAAASAAMPEPVTRMETEKAEVNGEESMTEYALPGVRDVPKNGGGTMADLKKTLLPAEYRVMTAAAEDPRAYLTASVKTAELPVSSAVSASVFLKDVYMGSTVLNPESQAEMTEISLGREERIRVSRREVLKKTSPVLLKGQLVTEYAYETKVTNLSGAEMTVVLKDQIPVSRTKEIIVEAKEIPAAELDPETGIVTKKLRIPAGGTVQVPLSWKVFRPKDKKIRETRAPRAYVPGSAHRKFCPSCGGPVPEGMRFCPECGAVV